jgi:hypothetical protein
MLDHLHVHDASDGDEPDAQDGEGEGDASLASDSGELDAELWDAGEPDAATVESWATLGFSSMCAPRSMLKIRT